MCCRSPRGARRRAGNAYAAVAALFVHKAALNTPSQLEVIAKTFKLTASELRVLLAIVQVGGVAGTAEALGVAHTTVKTHLRRLYAKTGTARQAELVKLVAGFPVRWPADPFLTPKKTMQSSDGRTRRRQWRANARVLTNYRARCE
jgi:DNA-binding CsgD family transcriptional regulator